MKNKRKVKQRKNIELWKMKQPQKRKVGKKGGIQVGIILCNISLHAMVSITTLLFFFKATSIIPELLL